MRKLVHVIVTFVLISQILSTLYFVDEDEGGGTECSKNNPCSINTALLKIDITELRFTGSSIQNLNWKDSAYGPIDGDLIISSENGIRLTSEKCQIFEVSCNVNINLKLKNLYLVEMFGDCWENPAAIGFFGSFPGCGMEFNIILEDMKFLNTPLFTPTFESFKLKSVRATNLEVYNSDVIFISGYWNSFDSVIIENSFFNKTVERNEEGRIEWFDSMSLRIVCKVFEVDIQISDVDFYGSGFEINSENQDFGAKTKILVENANFYDYIARVVMIGLNVNNYGNITFNNCLFSNVIRIYPCCHVGDNTGVVMSISTVEDNDPDTEVITSGELNLINTRFTSCYLKMEDNDELFTPSTIYSEASSEYTYLFDGINYFSSFVDGEDFVDDPSFNGIFLNVHSSGTGNLNAYIKNSEFISNYNTYVSNIEWEGTLFHFQEYDTSTKNLNLYLDNVNFKSQQGNLFNEDTFKLSAGWVRVHIGGSVNIDIQNSILTTTFYYGMYIYPFSPGKNVFIRTVNSKFRGLLEKDVVYPQFVEGEISPYLRDNWFISGCFHVIIMEGYGVFQFINSTFESFFTKDDGAVLFVSNHHWPYSLTAEFTGSKFSYNIAQGSGGVLGFPSSSDDKKINFTRCEFTNNHAYSDGAIFSVERSKIYVDNSKFTQNSCGMDGGCFFQRDSAISIKKSIFYSNAASMNGGVLSIHGESIFILSNSTFISNSMSEINENNLGGGVVYSDIWLDNQKIMYLYSRILNCLFVENYSLKSGGDLYLNGGKIVIRNSTFKSSYSQFGGSVIGNTLILQIEYSSFEGNSATDSGGSIYFQSDRGDYNVLEIRKVTITSSRAEEKGGGVNLLNTLAIFQNIKISKCESKDGSALYLKRSSLYFGDPNVNNEDNKIYMDMLCNDTFIDEHFGYSFIVDNSANRLGTIYIGEKSELVTKMEYLNITNNYALIGNVWMESEKLISLAKIFIDNNVAKFGAAFGVDISKLNGLNKCVKIGENIAQSHGDDFFFQKIQKIDFDDEKVLDSILKFDCLYSTFCNSYSSEPERIVPFDKEMNLFNVSNENVYNEIITVYSLEEFEIHLGLIDYFGNLFDSYLSDFVIHYTSDFEIITATEEQQQIINSSASFTNLQVREVPNTIIDFLFTSVDIFSSDLSTGVTIMIIECGEGFEPNESKDTCYECSGNYYKLERGMHSCLECCEGCKCEKTTVVVNEGYWFNLIETKVSTSEDSKRNVKQEKEEEENVIHSVLTFQCDNDRCLGGNVSYTDSGIEITKSCSKNYDGIYPLCKVCGRGYILFNNECIRCRNSVNWSPLFKFFGMQGAILVYIHLSSQKESKGEPNSSMRILMDFTQILAIVLDFNSWSRNSYLYNVLKDEISMRISAYTVAFKDFFSFLKGIVTFSPSMGSELTNDECPIRLTGFSPLFFKSIQPFIPIFVIVIPLILLAVISCIIKAFKKKSVLVKKKKQNRAVLIIAPVNAQMVMPVINSPVEKTVVQKIEKDDEKDEIELSDSKNVKIDVEGEKSEMKEIIVKKQKCGVILNLLKKIKSFIVKVFSFEGFLSTFLQLMIMTHSPITLTVIDFFMFSSGINLQKNYVLLEYPNLEVFNTEWFLWGLVYFPLLFYILIGPVIILLVLIFTHKKEKVKTYLGGLYQNYKEKFFWYEIIVIFRKVLLILLSKLSLSLNVSSGGGNQFAGIDNIFFIFVISLSLVIHIVCRPFYHKSENVFEGISLFAVLISIGLQQSTGLTRDIGMFFTIFVVCCAWTLLLFFFISRIGPVAKIIKLVKTKCCCCFKKCKKGGKGKKEVNQEVKNDVKKDL